jgi:hypothetical protein
MNGFFMKKLSIVIGAAFGAAIGLFTSIPDGLGLKIVMMSIGAVAGIAIGGAFSRIGSKEAQRPSRNDSVPPIGFPPEEQMNTYWRDNGKIYPMQGHPDPEGATRDLNKVV